MRSAPLSFQPRRSLTRGNIVAIEIGNQFDAPNETIEDKAAPLEHFLAGLDALIDELAKWHRRSLHGIPVSLPLPHPWTLDSRLLEALVRACEMRSLPCSFIEIATSSTGQEAANLEPLQDFKKHGFHTKLSFPWSESSIETPSFIACDTVDISLIAPGDDAVDMRYLSKVADLLTQARISKINTVARGVHRAHEYDAIVDCGLFTEGIGNFFWPPHSPEYLLRNELTFSRFFTTGWKQYKGRFIPTNPLYFQPWKCLY